MLRNPLASPPMRSRLHRLRLPLLLSLLVSVAPAADFVVTATRYEAAEQRHVQSLIYRELVRQGVVLAALHHTDLRPEDVTFDGYDTARWTSLPGVEFAVRMAADELHCRITRSGSTDDPWEQVLPVAASRDKRTLSVAAGVAAHIESGLVPWLRAHMAPGAPAPSRAAHPESARGDDEPSGLSRRTDPVTQFELLRHWHARSAAEGLHPEVLAGLARRYALLGATTRYTWNAFPVTCAARALLYAELLHQLHPDHPLANDTRLWVWTFTGHHAAALDLLQDLRRQNLAPAHGELLEASLKYRTGDLLAAARAGGPDAELATLLALFTLETQRLRDHFGRHFETLRDGLPHSIRAHYAANDAFGVGGKHISTEHGPAVWWATLTRRVPAVDGLPPRLRSSVADVPASRPRGIVAETLLELLQSRLHVDESAAPDPNRYRAFFEAARAEEDAGYPAWDVLGRMMWDGHLYLSAARLHFMAREWSVETATEVEALTPSFEGHPLQAVIRSYARGEESSEQIGEFGAVEILDAVPPMADYLSWTNRRKVSFKDRTATRVLDEMWWFSDNDALSLGFLFVRSGSDSGRIGRELLNVTPYHPAAIAADVRDNKDWPRVRALAAERQPDNPIVTWALADRLRKEEPETDIAPMLERAVAELDEPNLRFQLADLYLERGDEERWLATRLAYDGDHDTALSEARNYQSIAKHYLATRRPELARPHAQAAARSYAGWALTTAAFTEAILGNHADAQAIIDAVIERYGDEEESWLLWHLLAGYGDREAITARLRTSTRTGTNIGRDRELLLGVGEAIDTYLGTYDTTGDNYYLLLAALCSLEAGNPARARELLARIPAEFDKNKVRNTTRTANRDLAALFLQHLDAPVDAEAFTAAVGAIVRDRRLDRHPNHIYRQDFHYFAARFLRLRGAPAAALPLLRSDLGSSTTRYVLPLVAREFEHHGSNLLREYASKTPPVEK